MKKAGAVALALVFALTGCWGKTSTTKTDDAGQAKEESAQVTDDAGKSKDDAKKADDKAKEGDQGATVSWADAATAAEAAKAAGFKNFGVVDTVKLGDLEFANPTFSAAGGVAQAYYETGAAGLFIRKANGEHTVPLTDRDTASFAHSWKQSPEGLVVSLYGPEDGAATVATWTDGTQEFAVTYQGLGGEELTMNTDEVAALVKGLKEANPKSAESAEAEPSDEDEEQAGDTAQDDDEGAATPATSAGAQSQTQGQDQSTQGYISEEKAANIAYADSGLSEADTSSLNVQLRTGSDAPHYLVTIVQGDVTYTYEIDAYDGTVWSGDATYANGSSAAGHEGQGSQGSQGGQGGQGMIGEGDAVAVAEQTCGANAVSWYQTSTDEYGDCWYVICQDAAGNYYEYFVDANGIAYDI